MTVVLRSQWYKIFSDFVRIKHANFLTAKKEDIIYNIPLAHTYAYVPPLSVKNFIKVFFSLPLSVTAGGQLVPEKL